VDRDTTGGIATEMYKLTDVVVCIDTIHESVRMQVFQALDQMDDVYAV